MKKRRDIANAAFSLYVSEGPQVNLERVAEVAGVSKVTIYNHFQSKDALLVEVVQSELLLAHSDTERFLASHFSSLATVEEALESLARAWVKGVTSPRLSQLRLIVLSQIQRLPELGTAWMDSGPRRLHKNIASALLDMERQFNLSIPDVDLAVLQLAGLVVSPHVMYGPFHGEPDKEMTEQLIKEGAAIFLSYYSHDKNRT